MKPLRVVDLEPRVGGAVDVVHQAELAEGDREEDSPGGEVGVSDVEGDGDIGLDVMSCAVVAVMATGPAAKGWVPLDLEREEGLCAMARWGGGEQKRSFRIEGKLIP